MEQSVRLCVCEHGPYRHRIVGGKMMCDGCGGQDAMHPYREPRGDHWPPTLFFIALAVAIVVGGWLWG